MQNYEIKIDKDGIWYYNGAHMFRKEILSVFFQNLRIDECGKYLVELGEDHCYLDVEDTAFVVTAVYKTGLPDSSSELIEILLSDDSCEKLEMISLYTSRDNVLYCRVKAGRFTARFSRNSYYQIAEFIEQSENGVDYFINLNSEKYFIKSDQAL
jgi:uncharacterized protein